MVKALAERDTHTLHHRSHNGSSSGLIIRQKEPVNLETPADRLDSYITPAELFYIRSHFTAPEIDAGTYRLKVDGAVRNSVCLTYRELREMPSVTRVVTLECAGNGRAFLVPQVSGAQWELGAVGNAQWTGVPLTTLLERAGLKEDACEIVLEGADRGMPVEPPTPPVAISYCRSLPRNKATQAEVLIAYQMNGSDLPKDHGYPVRAIVPGHYGMASVKWLIGIHAASEPFQGYWQTSDYGYWEYSDGRPVRKPLGEMKVKSEIVRPAVYERLAPNQPYTITGASWAGESEIARLQVSADGGATWADAEFLDPAQRYAWRRWKFDWVTPRKPGRYILMARAEDGQGNVQPERHDPSYGTYVIDCPLPIEVFVHDALRPERG